MDGNWQPQVDAMTKKVDFYALCALKHRLSVDQATEFFNSYLLPKLEYGLRFVPVLNQTLKQWNVAMARCISHLSRTTFRFKPEALAVSLGLKLLSEHDRVVKTSELFCRLNGVGSDCDSARTRWLEDGLAATQPTSKAGEARTAWSTVPRA